MKEKISKTQAKEKIENFFSDKDLKNKTSKEIQKIKKLAMKYNLKLGKKKKLFCKKCLMPFSGKEKIRIKNKVKSVVCGNCANVNRWKIE